MKKKLLIFLTVVMVLLNGCYGKQNGLPDEKNDKLTLENTSWVLKKIDDDLFRPFILNGEAFGFSTLSFNNVNFSGNTGVNQFRGSYELENDNFETTPILTTKMAALNIILSNNEAKILEILNSNDKKLKQNSENLTIFSSKGTLFYQKTNPLKNSSWKLKTMPNTNLLKTENSKLPTIEFSQNFLYGFGGVNRYNAGYNLNGKNIEIGMIAATLMAGISEEENKLEREFFDLLNNAKTFEIDEMKNELYFGDMIFEGINFQSGILNNNVWNLVFIDDENVTALIEKYDIKNLTVQFKDNTISGFSGVNRFMGQYALANRNIYISPLASTMMFGINDEVNKLEQKFVDALSNSEYLELKDHETMIFYTDKNKLIFKRVYM